jgi:ADP-ribose pyrophosphatase
MVNKLLYFFLFLFFPFIFLLAKNESTQNLGMKKYLNFMEENACSFPCSNYKKSEIEVITDPKEIEKVQDLQEKRFIKNGLSKTKAKEFSRVGIISEDTYWLWVRDAVIFPSGIKGTYNRIIWNNSLDGRPVAVAVLPVLPNGKIVLNLNYRHATRKWELELPRGKRERNEICEQAAIRELQEETGLFVSSHTFLGFVTPDTGIMNSVVPVYIGKVCSKGKTNRDFSEAILSNPSFTKEEIKKGCLDGYIEFENNKKKWKLPIRDPFLFYALYMAELKGLL